MYVRFTNEVHSFIWYKIYLKIDVEVRYIRGAHLFNFQPAVFALSFSFDIFRFLCVRDGILQRRLKEHVTYCHLSECKTENEVY